MNDEATRTYYLGREQLEREMAARATDPAIRNVHQLMANSYRRMLDQGQFPRRGESARQFATMAMEQRSR